MRTRSGLRWELELAVPDTPGIVTTVVTITATVTVQRQPALMAITATLPTPALLTVTTAQPGSLAASLSAPVPGSGAATMAGATTDMVAATTVAVATMVEDTATVADIMAAGAEGTTGTGAPPG